jgi:putative LysE/RhtB family amino acid efflux pump
MNPITLLAFTAVFAGVGIEHATHTLEGLLVAGVFTGAASWWLLITTFAGLIHRKISIENLRWLTKLAGISIIGFGIFIFIDLVL